LEWGGVGWGEIESTWYVGQYLTLELDDDECGALGGIRIGRGNLSSRRKPTPMSLCPPQIPHDLTWARIRAAAVGMATIRLRYGAVLEWIQSFITTS
jgi:hypothetical protein